MENTMNVPAVVKAALDAQHIDPTKCNLMLPTETYGEVLGMFDKITFESIKVNPDPAAKEVYEPDGPGKGKALAKVPLQKIGIAMGIIWDPNTTGTQEDTDTKSRAKATGAIRKPNGDYVVISDEKTIDVSALAERDRLNIEDKAEKGNPDEIVEWKKTAKGKSYPIFGPWKNEAEKKAWIERAVRKAIIGHRLSKNEKANTGAKERVIRAFIAMKSTYTDEELELPFVYPCVSVDAAKMLANPDIRAAAIDRLTGSVRTIFGPGKSGVIDVTPAKALPAPEAEAAPTPRTVDEQSGEVLPAQAQPAEEGQKEIAFADDIPWDETPEDIARRKLANLLALERKDGRLTTSEGWKSAAALIRAMLDNEQATLAAMNELIARVEKWLAKNGVKVGDAA